MLVDGFSKGKTYIVLQHTTRWGEALTSKLFLSLTALSLPLHPLIPHTPNLLEGTLATFPHCYVAPPISLSPGEPQGMGLLKTCNIFFVVLPTVRTCASVYVPMCVRSQPATLYHINITVILLGLLLMLLFLPIYLNSSYYWSCHILEHLNSSFK